MVHSGLWVGDWRWALPSIGSEALNLPARRTLVVILSSQVRFSAAAC